MLTLESFLIGASIAGAILLIVGILLGIQKLAQHDILWTYVAEGTAKVVVRGESFSHTIMAFEGHHLNDPRDTPRFQRNQPAWEVIKSPEDWKDDRGFLARKFGIYWIGWIWPFLQVYSYRFRWTEETQDEETGAMKRWPRNESTDFIYIQHFPYVITLNAAETVGKLPVDLFYQLTVWINNPYKALFEVEDWLVRVTGACNRSARNFVGASSYEELTSETRDREKTEHDAPVKLSTSMLKLNRMLPDEEETGVRGGLPAIYGITISAAELLEVNHTGDPEGEAHKATTAKYIAEQKAEAVRAEAAGERDRIETTYKAILTGDETQEGRMHIRSLEALETAAQGPSNVFVLPSGVAESLQKIAGFFGGKKEG